MDIYDSDYRRQYCQERVAQIRDEYRRAQAPPRASQRRERMAAPMRAMVNRVRRQVPRREPAYRS